MHSHLTFLVGLKNSMHKPICFCETLHVDIAQLMSNVCCLGNIAPTNTAVFSGSANSIEKLKATYSGVPRRH